MAPTLLPTRDAPGALSRRTFLQGISAVLGATAAGGIGVLGDLTDAWGAVGDPLPAGTPVLVLIELNGGNDANNTLIPFAVDPHTGHYRDARPTLAATSLQTTRPYGEPNNDKMPRALDIGGGWALHGALPWMANRYYMFGDVAIVQGVGENVRREQSHFASTANYAAGAFTGPLHNSGWLGRYNDANNAGQALGAVSTFGSHDAFRSVQSPAVTISSLSSFRFWVDNIPDSTVWLNRFRGLGGATSDAWGKAAQASIAIDGAHAAMARAASVPVLPAGGSGAWMAQQLSVVASLINAGIPCQTYLCGDGGFDNHGSQARDHHARLRNLDRGLAQFFSLLNASPRRQDVFVVIYGEFGRKLGENGSEGTDHGLAQHVIVIGGGVQGGLHGQHPSLAPAARALDSMVATVDFRSVWATVLNRLARDGGAGEALLGRDESGNSFPDLGLWAAPSAPTATPDAPAAAEAPPVDQAAEPMPSSTSTTTAPAPTTTSTTAPAPTTTSTTAPAPTTTSTTAPATTSSTALPIG